ncbi:hypothetical protein BGW36DRAFT_369899 [Talaromyces proteolyticus]|uniref:Uncharacterized protein n=1 Tax=Talaromyces proteolyticus TaxID=1131652 RepID=A0AAD4KY77_9EURO|nr:uncharacterized protein BGW36DRAFT_369899 [Talaromyces proteolyticus]KAH8703736.1 hypothetical protein BGW36DRAFT_369899 [Talaromyces proteolyticus]
MTQHPHDLYYCAKLHREGTGPKETCPIHASPCRLDLVGRNQVEQESARQPPGGTITTKTHADTLLLRFEQCNWSVYIQGPQPSLADGFSISIGQISRKRRTTINLFVFALSTSSIRMVRFSDEALRTVSWRNVINGKGEIWITQDPKKKHRCITIHTIVFPVAFGLRACMKS